MEWTWHSERHAHDRSVAVTPVILLESAMQRRTVVLVNRFHPRKTEIACSRDRVPVFLHTDQRA